MRHISRIFAILSIFPLLGAFGAEKKPSARENFEATCLKVFEKRGGDASDLCKCASEESQHQGVTTQELQRETAKIEKDATYQIQNPKLLAAFHYCLIQRMDEKAHEQD